MHKITISYIGYGSHHPEGYYVYLYCDLVHDSKRIALLETLDDAIKFANRKATKLNLKVEIRASAKKKKEKK